MTPRENLISLARRKGFSEIPVEFVLCPSLIEKAYEKTGTRDYMEYFQMPWRYVEDIRIPASKEAFLKYFPDFDDRTTIDDWGVGHQKGSEAAVHMTKMLCPLREVEDIEDIASYPFPDYFNGDSSHQAAQVADIHKRGLAACGNMQMTIWEQSWYIRSMEDLMCDMMMEDEKADYLFDRVTELNIHRAKSFVKSGVDVLYIGDDIGMQSSIMMSEDLYCQYIKPRFKRLISEVKAINPEVLVFYHSCGFITPFIEHLIDVGVDVLNPIQPESMSFKEIHDRFGDRLSFHGTIGTQTTMPFGTPKEVRKQVEEHLSIAGQKGGLMVAPTHMLEPEVPWENIEALVDVCRNFAK